MARVYAVGPAAGGARGGRSPWRPWAPGAGCCGGLGRSTGARCASSTRGGTPRRSGQRRSIVISPETRLRRGAAATRSRGARPARVHEILAPVRRHAPGPDHELVLIRGEGAWIEDDDGRRYLDATAGLWYCNVGHGRAEIADAAAAPARDARLLLELRCLRAPRRRSTWPTGWRRWRRSRTPSSSSARAARMRWTRRPSSRGATGTPLGRPEKRLIVSREHAYHGMHAFGTGLVRDPGHAGQGYGGPIVGDTIQVGRPRRRRAGAPLRARAAARSPRSSGSR